MRQCYSGCSSSSGEQCCPNDCCIAYNSSLTRSVAEAALAAAASYALCADLEAEALDLEAEEEALEADFEMEEERLDALAAAVPVALLAEAAAASVARPN